MIRKFKEAAMNGIADYLLIFVLVVAIVAVVVIGIVGEVR